MSTESHSPPKGSFFERRTISHGKRLAKPLAASVSFRCRSSSALVMWPMIETCAPVAFVGLFLVRVPSRSPSQAWRIVGERVLPSLPITFSTLESSPSTTSRRLSGSPESKTTSSSFLIPRTSSRTA